MNQIVSKLMRNQALLQVPRYYYHFPQSRTGQITSNPAITAKRIIKVVGERLRKIDPQRWDTTPITFKTNWYDEAGYVDIATCVHVHDALEKEFGMEIKDRAFLVTGIEEAFYIVTLHHDSH